MNVLRGLHSIVVWVWLAVWSVVWISLGTVVAVFSREAALSMAPFWSRPIFWMARAPLQVEPLPDIDWKKPHVFLMNHQANLDIPAAFAALPVNLRFVAKHSLRWVPFMGWFMWLTGMIFVNRGRRSRAAVASLQRAGKRIRAGASILAFPEGTRSRDGKILPFKKGAFVVALSAGVPIVPIAIEGSGAVQPSTKWTIFPGPIRLKVGQPIPTEGRTPQDREALAQEVREAIIQLHREIGGQGGVTLEAGPAGRRSSGAKVRGVA